jgi:ankyrin repeat protein
MDFGGFILVGLLGIAFALFTTLAVAVRLKYGKHSKPILFCAGACLFLFLPAAAWVVYIYGLNEPLAIAAGEGNTSRVQLLLRFGASPNAEGVDGTTTALIAAAQGGHAEIVKVLLERGADANLKDDEDRTALDRAREGGYTAIVQMIQQASHEKK